MFSIFFIFVYAKTNVLGRFNRLNFVVLLEIKREVNMILHYLRIF